MPRVPVVYVGKDTEIETIMGDHDPTTGKVTVKGGLYTPKQGDWGLIRHPTWAGKKKQRGIMVREGFPLPVPLLTDQERKWPDSAALEAFYRANMAQGLSRMARGMSGGGDFLKSFLGLPRPLLIGILVVVAVIGYILLDPSYLQRVLGR